MDQAPVPPAVSRVVVLTSDPQRQLSNKRGLAAPLHPGQHCSSPSLKLELNLEEGWMGKEDGENGKNVKNNKALRPNVWQALFKTVSWFQLM